MSNEPDRKVNADVRENFGKGFARRLRAAGKIPAVIYGHGTEPVHVALPGHQVALLIRRANALLEIVVDGKNQLTLVKDVQRDPVLQIIEHIDLLVVKKGEKVQVDVPVTLVGDPAAGLNVNQHAVSILLEVEATHIPQGVEASVEGLEEGAHITAADLNLPKGASLIADPELLIVAISAPSTGADDADTTPAEGEALDTQAEAAAE
ncbi:50S ribosomal protein L25/general stress protein Ctc (plasmid) [Coraliomargarita sp. W4R53]